VTEQLPPPQAALRVAVVTGMSGAGRSTAARALEDLGWYVVDNMPPTLIAGMVELARNTPSLSRLAVVVDARGGAFFAELERSLFRLRQEQTDLQVVFLEATDEVLVRRFESSRRPHPMQGSGWLLAGIDSERALLANLRGSADLVIDTSRMSVHDLRRRIESMFHNEQVMRLRATLMSFGFKYGIPVDADIVFDARFLPNPYWIPELRPSTGLDGPVSDFVLEQRDARPFLDNAAQLIDLMAGGYLREGKRFVTIAVGCTGGKHRSVALAENLAARLVKVGVETSTVHRDLGRE
jgi:RNase adapter protein RapZ